MHYKFRLLLCVIFLVSGCNAATDFNKIGADPNNEHSPPGTQKPNVIFILVDDLGYGDLSLYGNTEISTPHIDSIGQNGVIFTHAYTSSSVCSPSRAGILTGRYQQRFGFEFLLPFPPFAQLLRDAYPASEGGALVPEGIEERLQGLGPFGLPQTEFTLPEMMRDAGYKTALVGKWHLGGTTNFLPRKHGFEEHVGFYGGASLYAPTGDDAIVNAKLDGDKIDAYLWKNLPYSLVKNGKPLSDRRYMTDVLAEHATSFISENREKPFFLMVTFNAPHTPLQAQKQIYDSLDEISDHRTRVYYSMIKSLDNAVGEILDGVRANGIEENTIVIFSSDNGGPDLGIPHTNAPFRGWKATYFEGGIVVPALMSWPGGIAPGRLVETPVSLLDMFPTIASLAGIELPDSLIIDGINLHDLATNGSKPERPTKFFWRTGTYRAIRNGDYKLQIIPTPEPQAWLSNVADDPAESRNLSGMAPEITAALLDELVSETEIMSDPSWPSLGSYPTAAPPTEDTKDVSDAAPTVYWPF